MLILDIHPRLQATHDLVIGSTRVVGPGGFLHDMPRDRFKVHQVVASSQRGHTLDALQAVGLLWVDGLFFLLDGGHVDLTEVLGLVEVLVECVGRVDGVEFLGRIFASILEDDF